uniref:EGF-like domain-containing protein n=1 Tax=Chromera velia CCMP2878 TaxID=1169474 RepID=A0A0G4FCL5_9ALVE|eukprot:Cvel_16152.t1-p1 / transcript=Cvel_16152.t1 / gene=Cvel_16152 / organism=Chromera_velia_CCMP2878 / gene_product=Fibrillin-1, putative / transcript_product=Fibrillin-1, putative / location=Cvel_scaffold1230:18550-35231(+) / protein_length=3010 / sequence_SO=supercontig / SO=protein_coding / is_pseudo=false
MTRRAVAPGVCGILLLILFALSELSAGVSLPPSDIGDRSTWSNDFTSNYNGIAGRYKDYAGSVCAGRYRAMGNSQWYDHGQPDELSPAAAFDRVPGSWTNKAMWLDAVFTNPGTSASEDTNKTLVLEIPCLVTLDAYSLQSRTDTSADTVPSKMEVFGSDDGVGWTLLSSFTGEMGWIVGETRNFTVSSALGPFSIFKFVAKRIARTGSSYMAISDIILYAETWTADDADECSTGAHNCDSNAVCTNMAGSFTCACALGFRGSGVSCSTTVLSIPPSDIGTEPEWILDEDVLYNGVNTLYRDYAGATCPGRFRAKANNIWYRYTHSTSQLSPAHLFDHVEGGWPSYTMWLSGLSNVDGTNSATDANETFVLEVPCLVTLYSWAVQARSDTNAYMTVSKMEVWGSRDEQSWTFLGSIEGVTAWTPAESKEFNAVPGMGSFSFFKFVCQRIARTGSSFMGMSEISLHALNWTGVDECALATHNCHMNATCVNNAESFTCECNMGVDGDGVWCENLLVPPPHIGAGPTWTHDFKILWGGVPTLYKDYNGTKCPGRYRISTNTWWWDYGDIDDATSIAGAFDRIQGTSADGTVWLTADKDAAGLNDASDSNIEIVVALPCWVQPWSWTVQTREGSNSYMPSKMSFWGSLNLITWIPLGSFESELWWADSEIREFDAVRTWYFNYFKFVVERSTSSSTNWVGAGEIELKALNWTADTANECADGSHNCHANATCLNSPGSFLCTCDSLFRGNGVACDLELLQIPSSDIGAGSTWLIDLDTKYSGVVSLYTDYAGNVCPGRYRAGVNLAWYDFGNTAAPTPAGLFDRQVGSWAAKTTMWLGQAGQAAGLNSAYESNVELMLELPCFVTLHSYGIQPRSDNYRDTTPSKLDVYGSTDGVQWRVIGGYSGHKHHMYGQTYEFGLNVTEAFSKFKFDYRKSSQTSDGWPSIGEIELFAFNWTDDNMDECSNGTHNCHPNATCTNNAGSFTCKCGPSFRGDGVSCDVQIILLPPADIGTASSWTEDATYPHGGLNTEWKVYTGTQCPGTYIAKASEPWWDYGQSDSQGPAGAFDRVVGSSADNSAWVTECCAKGAGTSSAYDSNQTVFLSLPCQAWIYSYALQSRSDGFSTQMPSKMNVYGSLNEQNWTLIGSYDGEMNWERGDTKEFLVDPSVGGFVFFKFEGLRISKTTDDYMGIGDIHLNALNWTELPDKCANQTHNCNVNATCNDTVISFICTCNRGFEGDGVACADAEECATSIHDCHSNATCNNTFGSFVCSCNDGWIGDGVSCSNVNECSNGTHNCHGNATCADNIGSFVCSCNDGWTGDGVTCTNEDECSLSSHDCNQNATCSDNIGSFMCSCNDGWIGDGVSCSNVNECSNGTHNCHGNATCADNIGSFVCSCNDGWTGDGVSCTNSDECSLNTHDCQGNATCTDNIGSFECPCNAGFNGTGVSCSDEDECSLFTHNCHANASCANSVGSFACECVFGFSGSGVSCTDDDECLLSVHNCHSKGACANSEGSFSCGCNSGFSGDGVSSCIDVDECTLGAHNCHVDAACQNTTGSFVCECNSPLVGDGVECDGRVWICVPAVTGVLLHIFGTPYRIDALAEAPLFDAEAIAFSLLDTKFEACLENLPKAEQVTVLTEVLEETMVTTPVFPEDDAAALALLVSLDKIGDLISELSQTGESVQVDSPDMTMLVSTFDQATLVFSAGTTDVSVFMELNGAEDIQGETVQGGFSERSPPSWSSLLGAMDRSERHFAEQQEGEEGRRSLVLLTTVDNPHPYAAGRTKEGGFLLEGATRYVRVQARQRRQVVGSGRIPQVSLSSFGGGGSRAQGGRSSGRRRLAEIKMIDSAEQLEVPVDEAKETAGALKIRAQGPDASAMLQQRGLLESSWEDLHLGLRGGEWVLECAQLDVQQELWTNAGCRFYLSEAEGEWWCACALRSLATTLIAVQRVGVEERGSFHLPVGMCCLSGVPTQSDGSVAAYCHYIPPPRHPAVKGEAAWAHEKTIDWLPGAVAVLWLWLLVLALLGGLGVLYLFAIRAERDLSPNLTSLDPQPDQKALLEKQSQAPTDKLASGSLSKTSAVTREVFDSERHRRRLGVFFTPRRVVGFLEARAWMSKRAHRDSKGGGQTTSDSTVRHGSLGRLRALVSQSPCAVCCRRLLLREETLAFVDARQLSRLRELNRLKLSAKMRGYLDGGEARQRLTWQQLDAELASRKYDMGLQFKSQAWEAEEGRNNFLLPADTWQTSVATFTTAQTFQSARTQAEAESESRSKSKNPFSQSASSSSVSSWESTQTEGEEQRPLSPSKRPVQPVGFVESPESGGRTKKKSADVDASSPLSSQTADAASPLPRPPRWLENSPAGALLSHLRAFKHSVMEGLSPSAKKGSPVSGIAEKGKGEDSENDESLRSRGESSDTEKSIQSGEWSVVENLEHLKYILFRKDGEEEGEDKKEGKEDTNGAESKRSEASLALAEQEPEKELLEIPESGSKKSGDGEDTADLEIEEVEEESPLVRGRESTKGQSSPWRKAFGGSLFFPNPSGLDPPASRSVPHTPKTPKDPSEVLRSLPSEKQPETKEARKKRKEERLLMKALKCQREVLFKTIEGMDEKKKHGQGRSKMAIVAPQGYARPGRLPLRKSLDTGHVILRLVNWPRVWLQSDASPLTDTLLFILRLVGTFCLCLILNAATVLVGETDDFHTPHTPVTLTTAPRQFHLPSSLDLLSFAPAAAVKILISFLALLLVVGSLLRPLCARVWSEESLFEDLHVVRQSPSDPSEEGERTDQSPLGRLSLPVGAEGRDRSERPFSAPDRKSTHKETRRSSLARAETKLAEEFSSGRLLYYNFGEAMSIRARPVRLPRAECAHRFVARRNLEVVVQKLLWVACGVAALVYLSLLAVATAEWKASRESANREEWGGLRGNQFCSRRPSVVLSEHSVGILIFFLLEILWCCLQALSRAMLLRLSLRSGLVRRFLNCFPRAAMFSDLHPEAEVKFGKDVVKALDAVPASNWIVPPERFDCLAD